MKYYTNKVINKNFDESVAHVTAELKKVGFGVLTEIKMHEKLKEKLDVDFRKYAILGACNPTFAHEAVKLEDKIGVLLPCNVVVQEIEEGKCEIAAMDPEQMMQALNNPSLATLAKDVSRILNEVIENL